MPLSNLDNYVKKSKKNKIISLSIESELLERFEKARKKRFPDIQRSGMIRLLIKSWLGDEVNLL